MKKILFICNANINRSKTAEILFKEQYETKSAGFEVYKQGTIPVSEELLDWADMIIVFEETHISYIKREYPYIYSKKTIINIELPDIYTFMSEDLQDRLKWKIANALKNYTQKENNIVRYHELSIKDKPTE